MSRPFLPPEKRRRPRITVQANEAEWLQIKAAAEADGQTVAGWLRWLALERVAAIRGRESSAR